VIIIYQEKRLNERFWIKSKDQKRRKQLEENENSKSPGVFQFGRKSNGHNTKDFSKSKFGVTTETSQIQKH